jgi:hypothetical protein
MAFKPAGCLGVAPHNLDEARRIKENYPALLAVGLWNGEGQSLPYKPSTMRTSRSAAPTRCCTAA